MTLKDFIEQNLNAINIDKKIFIELWDLIENKQWIYLTKEMVVDWMGYILSKDMMRDFIRRQLIPNYKENIDYKEVDKSHELVILDKKKETRGGSLKKYYIITCKTLITCLLRSQTKTSLRYAEYFYEIQNLLVKYYKSEYQDYALKLNEMLNNPEIKKYTQSQEIKYLDIKLSDRNKVGLVYFIAEENDLNYFKIGYTYSLNERLTALQISNRRKLEVYKYFYTSSPSILEAIIHTKFKAYLVMGEWYNINIEHINSCIIELDEN